MRVKDLRLIAFSASAFFIGLILLIRFLVPQAEEPMIVSPSSEGRSPPVDLVAEEEEQKSSLREADPLKKTGDENPKLALFQVGPEIDLQPEGGVAADATPRERELAESLPENPVYRRFRLKPLDWDALKRLQPGQQVSLPLPGGGQALGTVQLVDVRPGHPFGLAGRFTGSRSGEFSLVQDPLVGVRGFLMPEQGQIAFRISEEAGEMFLDEVDKGSVICHGMPKAVSAEAFMRGAVPFNPPVPLLQSRPEGIGVLYIDLDGEIVTDPEWNGGQSVNATAPVFSDPATIQKIWQEVSEAYAPFNINVTTDVSVYNNATPGRRMRIIVTSNAWYPAGGVAKLNSFQWSGTTPCWAFNGASNLDANIHLCAMTISHEFGHTFGLWHDGVLPANPNSNDIGAYYQGHMTPVGGWGPIMGAPFSFSGGYSIPIRPIVQWSKGDYAGTNVSSANIFTKGNNTQNDVGIIAGPLNQVGYVPDDFADNEESAAGIPQNPPNSGIISLTNGLIHSDSDVDVFRIDLQQGNLQVTATNGTPISPTLKLRLTLINPDRVTTNLVSDSANRLTTSFNTNLSTGTYYLRVEGVGTTTDTATTNGFVGYGSLGQYRLDGVFQNLPRPPGDNFSDECIRLDPPIANFSKTNTILGATAQTGERGYVSGRARNTIWYSWVAPGSGLMNLDTRGSGFDTTLAVCMVAPGKTTTLANLVLVAANDNADSRTNASAVRFSATAGIPYFFVVDSAKGIVAGGEVRLNGTGNLSAGRPSNDDFASAAPLMGSSFVSSNSLLAATAQPQEPPLAGLAATRSVWFSWTSPGQGRVRFFTTNSACDTVLGVYTGTVTGSNWSNLRLLAANDNITLNDSHSSVLLAVSNGVTYRIKVDSRRSSEGGFNLAGSFEPAASLATPTGISFILSNSKGQNFQPSISWNQVPGALHYEVNLLRGPARIYGHVTTNAFWTNGPQLPVTNGQVNVYGAQIRAVSNNLVSPWSTPLPAR